MSLEMVIGLLILLVVAAVIIRIFLGQTERLGETKQFQETLKYREFLSKCEGYCNEFMGTGNLAKGVQFCTSRLYPAGSSELGKKGVVDSIRTEDNILPITKAYPVCEDAVFCFQILPCKGDVGSPLDWPDCTQILCRYYYNTYNNWVQASAKVLEAVPNAGSCYIDPAENWWNLYFGSDPCGGLAP